MEAAIDRIMQTYDLLVNRSAAASAEARAKVTEYVDHAVRGRRKGHPSPDGVRPDLSARTRRQQRSGQGRIYGAVKHEARANDGLRVIVALPRHLLRLAHSWMLARQSHGTGSSLTSRGKL